MSNQAVIIDAIRSPIGVKNGEMVGIRPDDLAAQVVKGLVDRNPTVKPEQIEDLVMGCAFPEGPQGMLIGRSVSVLAGLPQSVPGKVVNRFCGSSMDALHQVSTAIESGDIDVAIAAGVEDMFSIPPGGFAPDFHPELAEQEYYIGMGETAENLANDGNISRETQEEFCIQSHEKALAAWEAGKFDNEVIPIDYYGEKTIKKDEGPRKPDAEKIKSLDMLYEKKKNLHNLEDLLIDIEDVMGFVMMWNWYVTTYGGFFREFENAGNPIEIETNEDSIYFDLPVGVIAYEVQIQHDPESITFGTVSSDGSVKIQNTDDELGLFNLIPIHPLDGGQIFGNFISKYNPRIFEQLNEYGPKVYPLPKI